MLDGDIQRFAGKEKKTYVNFFVDVNKSSFSVILIMFDQAAGYKSYFLLLRIR